MLAWLVVVFGLGGAGFSSDHTSRFLGPFLQWLLPDWKPWEIRTILFWIRKLAHVFEYAVTALLAFRALALTRPAWRPWQHAAPALLLVMVVGTTDEVRQSYLTTRTGTVSDVALDTAGGVLGVALAPWWMRRQRPGWMRRERGCRDA